MGWASGTYVCLDTWNALRIYVPEEKRAEALSMLIKALQKSDWDCEPDIADEWPEAMQALKLAGVIETR